MHTPGCTNKHACISAHVNTNTRNINYIHIIAHTHTCTHTEGLISKCLRGGYTELQINHLSWKAFATDTEYGALPWSQEVDWSRL